VSEPRRDTKWWGWGDPAHEASLDAKSLGLLSEQLGELRPWERPRSVEELRLPEAEALPDGIAAALGEASVFSGHEDRVRHSAGSGYVDLARPRPGGSPRAPRAR